MIFMTVIASGRVLNNESLFKLLLLLRIVKKVACIDPTDQTPRATNQGEDLFRLGGHRIRGRVASGESPWDSKRAVGCGSRLAGESSQW